MFSRTDFSFIPVQWAWLRRAKRATYITSHGELPVFTQQRKAYVKSTSTRHAEHGMTFIFGLIRHVRLRGDVAEAASLP
jgi:hypothetical protein